MLVQPPYQCGSNCIESRHQRSAALHSQLKLGWSRVRSVRHGRPRVPARLSLSLCVPPSVRAESVTGTTTNNRCMRIRGGTVISHTRLPQDSPDIGSRGCLLLASLCCLAHSAFCWPRICACGGAASRKIPWYCVHCITVTSSAALAFPRSILRNLCAIISVARVW